MLGDALTYPLRGSHTEGVFLPGLVLALGTAILLELPSVLALSAAVPATLLVGVLGRVYGDSIDGGTEPPPIGPLPVVTRHGVTVVGLATVYVLPAAVAVAVTVAGASATTVESRSLSFGSALRMFAGSTAVLLVVLAAVYVVPVAIGAALETGSVRRGLAVRTVVSASTDGTYFTAFWAGVVLVASAVVVSATLASLGRAGAVLGIALTFHVLIGATFLVGRGFGTDGSPYDFL